MLATHRPQSKKNAANRPLSSGNEDPRRLHGALLLLLIGADLLYRAIAEFADSSQSVIHTSKCVAALKALRPISDAESRSATTSLPGNAATRPVRQYHRQSEAQEESCVSLPTPGSWKTWRNSGGSSTRDWIR